MEPARLTHTIAELLTALQAAGYTVARRESGWHECLLAREDERWLGSGLDPDSALLDALNQALPSQLACTALAGWLERAGAGATQTPGARPLPGESELTFGAAASPNAASDAAPSARALESSNADAEPRLVWSEPPPTAAPPREIVSEAALPQPARVFHVHEEEAVEMLDELSHEIQTTVDEAALWAPERKRLLILKWISFARSVQDQANTKGVQSRVYAIAQELGRLSKIWWPGSVPALQLTARPSECQSGLELDAEPASWADVAEAASERLVALLESDEAQGFGEHGWADDASLVPAHADPEAELKSIVRKLEELTGSLDQAPVGLRDLHDESVVTVADARQWAERLRWLRGSAENSWSWGAAIGRLRWLSSQFGRGTPLHEVLDPGFKPLRTWAQYLGYDPLKKEKTRQKNQILKSFPPKSGAFDREVLVHWLRRGLECELISSARLAELLEPHREVLGDLSPDSIPGLERRQRKKLRKLQAHLRGEAAAEAVAEAEEDEKDEEHALDAVVPSAHQPLDEHLLAEVRAKTLGRRALIVTNRADPDLDQVLAETFGFSEVEHCEHSDRRIQAAAKRIQARSYDLVLSATGFQPHKVDVKLRKASVDAGIPYVRVNRARRQACLHALAREFGLLQRHGLAS